MVSENRGCAAHPQITTPMNVLAWAVLHGPPQSAPAAAAQLAKLVLEAAERQR